MRADLTAAFMLLTRLPLRGRATQPAARAAWAWPLVGLVVGGAGAVALAAALGLGAAPGLAAALALAVQVAATGALHEDGLADVADGFWGGRDRDRRLAIMRDSRLGSYGAIALILALLARWSLILAAATQPPALIAAAMASRAAMPALMRALPHARADGVSRAAGRPSVRLAGIALGPGRRAAPRVRTARRRGRAPGDRGGRGARRPRPGQDRRPDGRRLRRVAAAWPRSRFSRLSWRASLPPCRSGPASSTCCRGSPPASVCPPSSTGSTVRRSVPSPSPSR